VEVRRVSESRQRGAELGHRQRQDALDLGRVDRDSGDPEILTEELLGEQAAERVPDDDRLRVERRDDLGEVLGGVVDAYVDDQVIEL
jgi:hypothetical protein